MGRTIPLNEEAQRRARELYVPGVFGYKQVARVLGISGTSVRRYLSEEEREKSLRASREAKRRRTGVCERCGGETRYNGRTINGPSSLCAACNASPKETCKNGHALIPENRVKNGGGETCRLCRNAYMRERTARKRRALGVPEHGPYRRPKEEALVALLAESENGEGAAPK